MAILDLVLCRDCSLTLSGRKGKHKENFNKAQHILQFIPVRLLCHKCGPKIIVSFIHELRMDKNLQGQPLRLNCTCVTSRGDKWNFEPID